MQPSLDMALQDELQQLLDRHAGLKLELTAKKKALQEAQRRQLHHPHPPDPPRPGPPLHRRFCKRRTGRLIRPVAPDVDHCMVTD